MTVRFKFRAWDECNEIMHYDFQFIKSGNSGNDWIIFQSDKQKLDFDKEKNFCINVYPNPYFAQQLKIMQCTGLKDKNGKLIYEGDIVKVFHISSTMQAREYIGKVEYVFIKAGYQITNYGNFYEDDIYEVIGNIYENKEFKNERNNFNNYSDSDAYMRESDKQSKQKHFEINRG